MSTPDLEQRVTEELRAAYGDVEPSQDLTDRCRTSLDSSELHAAGKVEKRAARSRRHWPPLAAAAAAAIVMITIGVTVIVQNRRAAPSAPSSSEVTQTPHRTKISPRPTQVAVGPNANPIALCARPESTIARFWLLTAEPNPGDYVGSVPVGSAKLPASSIYVSAGPPGVGVLCVTGRAVDAKDSPIRAFTAASARPIAYLDADSGGIPYLAVAPGVDKVTLDDGTTKTTHTTAGTGESQLQSLGGGWHVLTLGASYASTKFTVTAQNSKGATTDTRRLQVSP